jgi:hypothetical protein
MGGGQSKYMMSMCAEDPSVGRFSAKENVMTDENSALRRKVYVKVVHEENTPATITLEDETPMPREDESDEDDQTDALQPQRIGDLDDSLLSRALTAGILNMSTLSNSSSENSLPFEDGNSPEEGMEIPHNTPLHMKVTGSHRPTHPLLLEEAIVKMSGIQTINVTEKREPEQILEDERVAHEVHSSMVKRPSTPYVAFQSPHGLRHFSLDDIADANKNGGTFLNDIVPAHLHPLSRVHALASYDAAMTLSTLHDNGSVTGSAADTVNLQLSSPLGGHEMQVCHGNGHGRERDRVEIERTELCRCI